MDFMKDLRTSYLQMPLWVQVWVSAVLVPANLLVLFFLDEPYAVAVLVLSVLGLAFNLPAMIIDRGFTSRMAYPHIVFWTPQVFLVLFVLLGADRDLSAGYTAVLIIVLVTNTLSLAMDYPDAWRRITGSEATD